MNFEWIGYLAATLTTAAFVPQVWKSLKHRDTQSISLSMYVIFTLGVAMWLAYGVFLNSWPMMIANTITLFLSAAILWMKITEKPSNHDQDH